VVVALDLEAQADEFAEPVLRAERQVREGDALSFEDALARGAAAEAQVGVPPRDRRREVVHTAERELPEVVNARAVRVEVLAGELESEVVREEVADAPAQEQKVVLVRVAGAVDVLELPDAAVPHVG